MEDPASNKNQMGWEKLSVLVEGDETTKISAATSLISVWLSSREQPVSAHLAHFCTAVLSCLCCTGRETTWQVISQVCLCVFSAYLHKHTLFCVVAPSFATVMLLSIFCYHKIHNRTVGTLCIQHHIWGKILWITSTKQPHVFLSLQLSAQQSFMISNLWKLLIHYTCCLRGGKAKRLNDSLSRFRWSRPSPQ